MKTESNYLNPMTGQRDDRKVPDSPLELDERMTIIEKKLEDQEKLIIRLYKEFGITLEADKDPKSPT